MSLEYATRLDIGARKRSQGGINEDSVAVNLLHDAHLDTEREIGVFVLADGAGGEQGGDVASYVATVEVARRLTGALWESWTLDELIESAGDDAEQGQRDHGAGSGGLTESAVTAPLHSRDGDWVLDRIETAVRSTHTRLLQQIQTRGLESAYTTIVVGVKIGAKLYYAWVGDSRAYVVNCHAERPVEQRLSRLTRDHSLVERLREQGEIDEVEAHVHRKGNRITRALGGTANEDPAASTVQVETGRIRLFADDVVLFTSDGLIDAYADAATLHEEYRRADATDDIEAKILDKSVTDDEIRDVILAADSLSGAADRYLSLANRRGGKDNISLLLFRDSDLSDSPLEGLPDRTYDRSTAPLGNHETIIRDRE